MRRFVFAALICASLPARADVVVHHQGYLLDATDQPVESAGLSASFAFFPDAAPAMGEVASWSSGACTVPVRRGYYQVALGAGCGPTLPASALPTDAPRWLDVTIGGVHLAPRTRLDPLPAASTSADTQALIASLSSATGAVNTSGLVHWNQLVGVPGAFADESDDGATYDADETTLQLTGSTFSVKSVGAAALASDADSLEKVSGGTLLLASGDLTSTGSITVSGAGKHFSGDGSGLTNLNAAELVGLVPEASLPSSFTNGTFSSLSVNGPLQLGGTVGDTCGSLEAGTQRFNAATHAFEGCDGSSWLPLTGSAPQAGSSQVSFDSAGSTVWTVPAGIHLVGVQLWGAGGAGGGSQDAASSGNPTAGGGGGGYSASVIAVTPGQQITITVGAGGTSSNGAAGTSGGTTSFGPYLSATGGAGSPAGSAVAQPGGGAGGRGNAASGTAGGPPNNGNVPCGQGGTAGGPGGGLGGVGANVSSGNGSDGQAPGGGGGGCGWAGPTKGGSGAAGRALLTLYSTPASTFPISFDEPGSYNWTVPSGVTKVAVRVWGAGGAGGGSQDAGSGGNPTAGGGAGGYSTALVDVTPGQIVPVVVGAGGVSSNGAAGTAGGSSAFGAITASGGAGSGAGGSNAQPAGGAGGTGSTMSGTAGGPPTNGNVPAGRGGAAGGPGGGAGGTGATVAAGSGGAGQFPGGGGGGCGWSGPTRGGNGAGGRVQILAANGGIAGTGSPVVFDRGGVFAWTVPSGVTQVTAKVWGAGGAGGGSQSAGGDGNPVAGAGGGGYSTGTVSVTPGQVVTVTVGHGGVSSNGVGGTSGGASSFLTLTASGGAGSAAGRSAPQPPGAAGGSGSTANGSAGSPPTSGNVPAGNGGAAGGPGGGTGGAGAGQPSGSGANGAFPGGGGGGAAWSGPTVGGAGADGEVILTW